MRHCSTTALPPTGRSALIFGASTGVEPFFNLTINETVHPVLLELLKKLNLATPENISYIAKFGTCQDIDIPFQLKQIFKTATEINPYDHLKMVAGLIRCVDESLSKTINLPKNATLDVVKNILLVAYYLDLKGITIYVAETHKRQPVRLAK